MCKDCVQKEYPDRVNRDTLGSTMVVFLNLFDVLREGGGS